LLVWRKGEGSKCRGECGGRGGGGGEGGGGGQEILASAVFSLTM
uniref:Uncharacterized protein n=1 Tax=Mesocestoides corti TaxID=53468 RepID=A0A0R3UCS8_MESCO